MTVVDLTRPITNGMHAHVTTSIVPLQRIGESAGRFDPPCEGFAANLLVMSDHCGTHLDAPSHFIRDGLGVEDIPLSRLIGPAVVLDVSGCPGNRIEADDLEAAMNGIRLPLRAGEAALLRTRAAGGEGKGLARSAAELLAASGISAVGTDHTGIDDTAYRDRPAHMTLLAAGIPIVENLINLDQLTHARVLFVALPLRIEGGTGSPVRAVAIHPYDGPPWSAAGESPVKGSS